jgi:CRISPR-associated endoribonuclease Cas6
MLNLPKREIIGDRFRLSFPEISFIISFLADRAMENFIAGMFLNQKLKISDRKSEAEFDIKTVEAVPEPEFTERMKFRTLSPVILSKRGIYKEKESEIYLKPENEEYFGYLKKNLEEKYLMYCNASKIQVKEDTIKYFKITNHPKEHLISIKPGRFEETKMKCYSYDFEVEGPPDMIKLAYDVGIGKMCSGGFGCIEPLF